MRYTGRERERERVHHARRGKIKEEEEEEAAQLCGGGQERRIARAQKRRRGARKEERRRSRVCVIIVQKCGRYIPARAGILLSLCVPHRWPARLRKREREKDREGEEMLQQASPGAK